MGNSNDVFFSTQDETAEVAAAHHDRMQAFRAKLPTNRGVFGAIDVGEGCYWWDYGQLKLYLTNNVLAMNESEEAAGKFLLTRLRAIGLTCFLVYSPSRRRFTSPCSKAARSYRWTGPRMIPAVCLIRTAR